MGPRFSDPGIFTVFLTTASTSTLEWSPIQFKVLSVAASWLTSMILRVLVFPAWKSRRNKKSDASQLVTVFENAFLLTYFRFLAFSFYLLALLPKAGWIAKN